MNKKIKLIFTSLMCILVSIFIWCNCNQVNAYNLPSYEVISDYSLVDDLKALGYDLNDSNIYNDYGAYDGLNNSSQRKWDILTMTENYTEKEDCIIQYLYVYCNSSNVDTTIDGSDIPNYLKYLERYYFGYLIFNLNDSKDYYCEYYSDNRDSLDFKLEYIHALHPDGNITDDRNVTIDEFKSSYKYNIIKFRLDLGLKNKDESRTYKFTSICGVIHNDSREDDDFSHIQNDYDVYENFINKTFTFKSVYDNNDNENEYIDIPDLVSIDNYNDKFRFGFKNMLLNSDLKQIKLNTILYDLEYKNYEWKDNEKTYYYIIKDDSFSLESNGTKTYNVNGYIIGDKYYDLSSYNVSFKYVKEKTSIHLNLKNLLLDVSWVPFNYISTLHFNVLDDNGNNMNNITSFKCRYYDENGKKHIVVQDVKKLNLISQLNYTGTTLLEKGTGALLDFAISYNSNLDGSIYKYNKSLYNQNEYTYKWCFGFKLSSIELLLCEYEVEDCIMYGSFFENGLFEENEKLYDKDGVLITDVLIGEDGDYYDDNNGNGIVDDDDKEKPTDTGSTTPTEDDDDLFDVIIAKLKELWNKFKKTILIIGGLYIGIILLPVIIPLIQLFISGLSSTIKAIINLFHKK